MQPFTIVGGGRVGTALFKMGQKLGVDDALLKRGDGVPEQSRPIIVCTRNDTLDGIVDMTPASQREDLVFIQNGMLQPWLEQRGLAGNTQALIYFAVAKQGDTPTDGVTRANPEGLTAVTGKHADAFAGRLRSSGLACTVLPRTEYQKRMLEKLIWICAFMLVGARHEGCTVGEVASEHVDEVSELIDELARAGSDALDVQLDGGYLDRLLAYAESVAHFPTAVKELPWRNGWFQQLSEAAIANGKPDPCPTHSKWLTEVLHGQA